MRKVILFAVLAPVLLAGCQSPEKLSLMSNEELCDLRVYRWNLDSKMAEMERRGLTKNCKNDLELTNICEEAAGLKKGTPAYADCVIKVTISQKERKLTYAQCVTACVKGHARYMSAWREMYCEGKCGK